MTDMAHPSQMMSGILTSLSGQQALPRYFAQAFARAERLNRGRLDVVLPDGRRFRAEGREAGHQALLHVHDDDLFGRLIREGDVGFAESYMEGGWMWCCPTGGGSGPKGARRGIWRNCMSMTRTFSPG